MLHSDVQPGDFSVCALWKRQGPGKPGPCWFLGVELESGIGGSDPRSGIRDPEKPGFGLFDSAAQLLPGLRVFVGAA